MKKEDKKEPSLKRIEAGKSGGFTEEEVILFEEMMKIERRAFIKGLSIGIIVLGVLIAIRLFL